MADGIDHPTKLVSSPSGPLKGRCRVPGDKSVSHRAIIMAALADGTSALNGLADGADVRRTLEAVQAFGARVETRGRLTRVTGCRWQSPAAPIDCGNSGTAARLLIGAAAAMPGLEASFTGDASLGNRPMARLVEPLMRMGARIEYDGHSLPIRVAGQHLEAITHRNAPASAQVKTALLLAGLQAHGLTRIIEPQKTRTHGEVMLRDFGCRLEAVEFGTHYALSIAGPQQLKAARIDIGGDPSSAAFPLVAGLIVPGSSITINNMLASPERTGLLDVLSAMGANLDIQAEKSLGGDPLASVSGRYSQLKGVDVPASMVPAMIDEYPIAAIAASFAAGTTIFHGLGELRLKESNRLDHLAYCLKQCGVVARARGEDLIIVGDRQPHGNVLIDSCGDHRIAMALATLGLASRHSVFIGQADVIGTGFPSFTGVMGSLGARLEWTA